MKKIAYTVVSENHLFYAKTWVDSFSKIHPEYKVFVCLAGEQSNNLESNIAQVKATVVLPQQINDRRLDDMLEAYSIVELCCAYKPFYAVHLLETMGANVLVYMDADIFMYAPLENLDELLAENNMLITPHIFSPLPNDDLLPNEKEILKSGLYNAGFWAATNSPNTLALLNWWKEREYKYGYYNFEKGMGVDQLWLNLVPIFFPTTGLVKHLGYNVAYWNIHERTISDMEGRYKINGRHNLIFYHFSGLNLDDPACISKHQNRYTELEATLQMLFDNYKEILIGNQQLFSIPVPELPVAEEIILPKKKKIWKMLFSFKNGDL